jgi:tetratricopeptide (TPR) repeat protein
VTSVMWLRRVPFAAALAASTLAGCGGPARPSPAPAEAEAVSLFGTPLVLAPLSPDARAPLEVRLADARAAYNSTPGSAEAIIWLGRRTAYLGRYREAIAIFSRGIALYPGDARLYRHRGHRYITTRRFALAVRDLERAAALARGRPDEVEADGQPNARGIPTSTLQFNIWYHLGLAQYLRGDFAAALRSYERCLDVSRNPDSQVASRHWLYMTLRRMGRADEAARVLEPVRSDMDILENGAYHRLLLLYKSDGDADELLASASGGTERVTLGYGVGNWHLYNGRRERAVAVFRAIAGGDSWASFGAIAAETDLHRLGVRPQP